MIEVLLTAPFAGWLSNLDEVADPVFAGRMMGDGWAIDPTEGLLRAPADGEIVGLPASTHAVTLRLTNGAELLIHVGLDTVALQGRGFEARVKVGDRVAAGTILIAFDLDAIARSGKDLVTPMVLPGEGVTVVVESPGRLVAAGDPIARVLATHTVIAEAAAGGVVERRITVSAPYGIHARPAARIVALLKPYAATVELASGDRRADGRSTVALLALGARNGDALSVSARGADAGAALDALSAFAAMRFGDPVGEPSEPSARSSDGGIGAAPGLAIGRILQHRPAAIDVVEQGEGVEQERRALAKALDAAAATMPVAEPIGEAHHAMLSDPQLIADAQAAIAAGKGAGWAWRTATDRAADALLATGDARLAERVADLRDVERQVLLALGGVATAAEPAFGPDTILVAEDLLPSQFLQLDRTRLAGICTAAGGPTAHVVLLAALAGVPMVVAAGRGVLALADGVDAILDADAGTLTADPSADLLAAAIARRMAMAEGRVAALRAAMLPAVTNDGVQIQVFANLGSIDDAAAAMRGGAEGCGLLRTEFLFLDRAEAPDEDEQRALYTRIATTLGDRPMIVRTLDIGGDKPVPYLPYPPEENPALGARGIRLSLARPDLLATQLRAILAAVPGDQCRILLPMVSELAEVRRVRAMMTEAMVAVGRTAPAQLGVMIETPAAAVLAEQLAAEADFLSIGTNDLTQYVLAADRGNAAVAQLVDAHHPAVLRLIQLAARGAAAHGRMIGVCGGLASDPQAAALLIGLGVNELSATPAMVPAVKAAIRTTAMPVARRLAERALAAVSAAEVRAIVEDAQ